MLLHTLSALVRLHELKYHTTEDTDRKEKEIKRCESELPPEVLKRYHQMEEQYGETALVPIANNVCTGCFIKQPNLGVKEITDQIYQCQYCGRLMYNPQDLYDESGF